MKNQLDELRKKIDKLDDNLLKILAKRFEVVKKIGQNKKKFNIPTADKKRFNEVLKTRINKGKEMDLNKNLIEKIYKIIHYEALKIENLI